MKLQIQFLFFAVAIFLAASAAYAQLACTRFYPSGGVGTVGIYNNCNKCMTASMGWCDGSIHRTNVPANNGVIINVCIGTVTLVGESPCSGASLRSVAAEKAIPMTPSAKTGIATLVSRLRVTTKNVEASDSSGSTCSASNELGDVCSI